MPGVAVAGGSIDPVEEVDDLDVGELLEAGEAVGVELFGDEGDHRHHAAPVVIDGFRTW
jgi:hypothetical protein